jgi:uncharacterized protein (DUF983 family)
LTYDEAAISIMLSAEPERVKARRLAKLALRAAAAVGAAEHCPHCGGSDLEDNAHAGRMLEHRCVACEHRFGPGVDDA